MTHEHNHESEIAAELRKLNEAQQAAYRVAWYQQAFFMVFEDWLKGDESRYTVLEDAEVLDGVLLVCHHAAQKVVANMKPEPDDGPG